MDLVTIDNKWVEDRGNGAPLDCKEGHNRVVEEDIRVARTKGGILSNFTSCFRFTAKTISTMSQPTSSLTRDHAFLPRARAVANEEDGPIDIWICEERDRHISRTITCPETTIAPGWEQYPSAYVVHLTLMLAR